MFLSEKHANALNNAPGSSFRDTAMDVLNGRVVSVGGIGSLDSAKKRVTLDLSSWMPESYTSNPYNLMHWLYQNALKNETATQ